MIHRPGHFPALGLLYPVPSGVCVISPGEIYLALLSASLCSCLACYAIVRLRRGKIVDLHDCDLVPVRGLLGWKQVRKQRVGFMDGGPHRCVPPRKGGRRARRA